MNNVLQSTFHSFSTVPITVGYGFTIYTTSEGQGMVELSVIISNPPSGGAPRPFNLTVNTENDTAGTCVLFTVLWIDM